MKHSMKRIAAWVMPLMILWTAQAYGAGEDSQILSLGGTVGSIEKDGMEVSKTISETGTENCFDITVTIKAKAEVSVLAQADAVYTEVMGDYIEFIGFFANAEGDDLVIAKESVNEGRSENTSEIPAQDGKTIINRNFKNSVYQVEHCDDCGEQAEAYIYTLKYRIRLKNEEGGFTGSGDYCVGDRAALTYRCNGNESIQVIECRQPMINGFFGQLAFKLTDRITGRGLSEAEFLLSHSRDCAQCRAIGSGVMIEDIAAVSDADGNVIFNRIPSGHGYILAETKAPEGYRVLRETYGVNVSYGRTDMSGNWEYFSDTLEGITISSERIMPANNVVLPKTGGFSGLGLAMGMIFMAIAMAAQGEHHSGGKRTKTALQKRTIKK